MNYYGRGFGQYERPEPSSSENSQMNDPNGYRGNYLGGESQNSEDYYNQENEGHVGEEDLDQAYYGNDGVNDQYMDDNMQPVVDPYTAAYAGMGNIQQDEYQDDYANIDFDPAAVHTVKEDPEEKKKHLKKAGVKAGKGKKAPKPVESESEDKPQDSELESKEPKKEPSIEGSGEKIVKIQDIRKYIHDEEESQSDRKSDALALAGKEKKQETEASQVKSSQLKEIYKEISAAAKDAKAGALTGSIQSDLESKGSIKESPGATADKDKLEKQLKDGPVKAPTATIPLPEKTAAKEVKKALPELNPADTYEEDFESMSLPATSRSKEFRAVKPDDKQENGDNKNDESSDESKGGAVAKLQYWGDRNKDEEDRPEEKELEEPKVKAEPKTKEEPKAKEDLARVWNTALTQEYHDPQKEEAPKKETLQSILKKKEQEPEPKPSVVAQPPPAVAPQVIEIVRHQVHVEEHACQTDFAQIQFSDKSHRELQLEAALSEEKKKSKTLVAQQEELDSKLLKLQETLRKSELECLTAQKQAATSGETIKKMLAESKETLHQLNLAKIEKEHYAKVKQEAEEKIVELEKERMAAKEEFEKQSKLIEERAETKLKKNEERALGDFKASFNVEKGIIQKQLDETNEELGYLKTKCVKLEAENGQLKIDYKAKLDNDTKYRELQQENYVLKVKLEECSGKQATSAADIKEGSVVELRKEKEQLENLVKGYQKENERMVEENKHLKEQVKATEALMYKESLRMKGEQNKLMRETEKAILINNENDVDIKTWNNLAPSNVISVGEVKTMKMQMNMLQTEKTRLEEKMKNIEFEHKNEVAMLLEQRAQLEDRLGMKFEDMQKEKCEKGRILKEMEEMKSKHEEELKEIKSKNKWLLENQELLDKNEEKLREKDAEIAKLNTKLNEICANKGISMRRSTIAKPEGGKKVRFAETGSGEEELGMAATKASSSQLRQKVATLEKQLKESEATYESKLRSLKQQYEKLKQKSGKQEDTELQNMRISQLEKEKEEIKEYYVGKLREMQEKENVGIAGNKASLGAAVTKGNSQEVILRNILCEVTKFKNALNSGNADAMTNALESLTNILNEASRHNETAPSFVSQIVDLAMDLNNETGGKTEAKMKIVVAMENILYSSLTGSSGHSMPAVLASQNLESEIIDMPKKMQALNPPAVSSSIGLHKSKRSGRYDEDKGATEELQEEGEEYWSDFSDEDYANDDKEDSVSISVVSELQKWLTTSKLTLEYLKSQYDSGNVGTVTPMEFLDALAKTEFECDPICLIALLKRLAKDNVIDYVLALDNLKTKNIAWWTEYLHNRSFDMRNRVSKKGNMCGITMKNMMPFVKKGILEKIKGTKEKDGLAGKIFNDNASLTKSVFRKQLLVNNLPFTREEARVVMKLCDPHMTGQYSRAIFHTLMTNPEKFLSQKLGSDPKPAWAEAKAPPQKRLPLSTEIYSKLASHMLSNSILIQTIEKAFRFYDSQHNAHIDAESFLKACREDLKLPLNTLEARTLFEELKESKSDKYGNYLDFIEKLKDAQLALHPGTSSLTAKLNDAEYDNSDISLDHITPTTVRNLKFQLQQKIQEIAQLQAELQGNHSRAKDLNLMKTCQALSQANKSLEARLELATKEPRQRQILELHKKVEALEKIIIERDSYIKRVLGGSNNLELSMQAKKHEMEKSELLGIVENKNREIEGFRKELDKILMEMQGLKKKKGVLN